MSRACTQSAASRDFDAVDQGANHDHERRGRVTLRERCAQLQTERDALKARLGVVQALDAQPKFAVSSAVAAVAQNLAALRPEERERTILAIAVLFGVIKPPEKS